MDDVFAVLKLPDIALVRWPDNRVTREWELAAGTRVHIDWVSPVEDGFIGHVRPVGEHRAEVFALVNLRDLELEGAPVPF